jgi:hypothetical protein
MAGLVSLGVQAILLCGSACVGSSSPRLGAGMYALEPEAAPACVDTGALALLKYGPFLP